MKRKEEKKVIEWQCPYCPKVISSMYEGQLESNKINHLMTHKKMEEEK